MAYAEAVNDLRFLGKRLRGIIELADVLEGLDQLENTKNELAATIETLKAERADWNEKVKKAKLKHDATLEELAEAEELAQAEFKAAREREAEEAGDLIEDASIRAAAIVKDADETVASIHLEINAAKEQLASIKSQVADANQRYEEALAKIQKLKASI